MLVLEVYITNVNWENWLKERKVFTLRMTPVSPILGNRYN